MSSSFPPFDYDAARAGFSLPIPENYNFAFDVIAKRAREADKTALIAVDRTGVNVNTYRYSDLDRDLSRPMRWRRTSRTSSKTLPHPINTRAASYSAKPCPKPFRARFVESSCATKRWQ